MAQSFAGFYRPAPGESVLRERNRMLSGYGRLTKPAGYSKKSSTILDSLAAGAFR